MKTLILISALCSLITSLPSSANPLLNYFTLDKTVSAEVGVILPPKEIQMYQRKIQVALPPLKSSSLKIKTVNSRSLVLALPPNSLSSNTSLKAILSALSKEN